MTLQPADILYIEDTGEYLLLIERKERENDIGYSMTSGYTWDMVDIVNGNKYWEWEYVLEGSGQYVRVA